MLIEWGSTWYSGSSEEHLQALERIVNKALAIGPDDAMATYLHGYVQKRLHKNLISRWSPSSTLSPSIQILRLRTTMSARSRSSSAAPTKLPSIRLRRSN